MNIIKIVRVFFIQEHKTTLIADLPPLEINKEYPAPLDLRQTWGKRNK